MDDKYIEAAWNEFAKTCIPVGASEIQVKDLRNAFYGGAATLWQIIMVGLTPSSEPTDQDMHMMENLQQELDEFGADLDKRAFGGTQH